MTYDLSPLISRMTLFPNEGGALASVDVNFGPIMVRARLYRNQRGYFLSWPSRKGGDQIEKWFEQVAIGDRNLKKRAEDEAVKQYHKLSSEQLVAV